MLRPNVEKMQRALRSSRHEFERLDKKLQDWQLQMRDRQTGNAGTAATEAESRTLERNGQKSELAMLRIRASNAGYESHQCFH